jgi:peptide chain release factor 2
MIELQEIINKSNDLFKEIKVLFNLKDRENRLEQIKSELESEKIWSNIELSAKLSKEQSGLVNIIDLIENLDKNLKSNSDIFDLLKIDYDENLFQELFKSALDVQKKLNNLKIKSLFTDINDKSNCFLEINAGAGGVDSQDWTEMLLRMYNMWANKNDFKFTIIDKSDGEEAGIKSVIALVEGEYACGLLKNETGTHRLVRISPFNANGKRQTSFAGIFVYPEISDEIKIEIDPKDIRIDVFKSSGAGGQHVNKTESAIRITHTPSGIVVQSQTQRSQIQNRENAMKLLKSKLYELELKKQEEQKSTAQAGKSDISWGNQIRNYVLHPYQIVKDVRSGYEAGDIQSILDGDISELIEKTIIYIKNN